MLLRVVPCGSASYNVITQVLQNDRHDLWKPEGGGIDPQVAHLLLNSREECQRDNHITDMTLKEQFSIWEFVQDEQRARMAGGVYEVNRYRSRSAPAFIRGIVPTQTEQPG